LLLYVVIDDASEKLDLIDPAPGEFFARHHDRRGEGCTHRVDRPNLRACVEQVHQLGATMAGESYGHTPWQKASLVPDAVPGMLFQLAHTDRRPVLGRAPNRHRT
jgi:hypothetical protein